MRNALNKQREKGFSSDHKDSSIKMLTSVQCQPVNRVINLLTTIISNIQNVYNRT